MGKWHQETLFLRQELKTHWQSRVADIFNLVRNLQGEEYRNREGRRTFRCIINDHPYFIKFHSGIGWREILKNLLQGRLPVLGARNEWQAIQLLDRLGLHTMTLAGYGERGSNPAKRQSFIITDELQNTMSLEHLGQQWRRHPPAISDRVRLIHRLADISRHMHEAGMNHRDYYLCHFLTEDSFAQDNRFDDSRPLYLIDLHRAQLRKRVPPRWRRKDLAGLYFSAMDVPLSDRDLLRFIRRYRQRPLNRIFPVEQNFWQRVRQQARALYAKTHGPAGSS